MHKVLLLFTIAGGFYWSTQHYYTFNYIIKQ